MKKSEGRIQQEIVKDFRNKYCLKHHNPKCLIFSVPNERSNAKEQGRMIATGLYSGVSDLIVVIPDHVFFVEVKDEIGKQSDKQLNFESTVNDLGFKYIVVRSKKEFESFIIPYLESF